MLKKKFQSSGGGGGGGGGEWREGGGDNAVFWAVGVFCFFGKMLTFF